MVYIPVAIPVRINKYLFSKCDTDLATFCEIVYAIVWDNRDCREVFSLQDEFVM